MRSSYYPFTSQPARPDPEVPGLDSSTLRNYDLCRLLRAAVDPSASSIGGAGFEFEVSDQIAKHSGRRAQGVFIPAHALTRDLTVGTATAGGHTVATELRVQNFIDLLRPKSIVGSLGATSLSGLVGNTAIPRQNGAASAYWLAENGAPTESQPSFDQVTMSPKTVGAFTDISRRMILQSSLDAAHFVTNDLLNTLAQAIDLAALAGTGADNQPLGLLNNTGITTKALGADGAPLTWAHIVDMETQIHSANGAVNPATCGFATTKQARGKLTQTFLNATYGDRPLWQNPPKPELPGEGIVNGYRAAASTLMPSNLTKGTGTNLSSMIYGDWSQLMIGMWGAIDLLVDPYSGGTSGAVRIVAMADVDIIVRHAESFVLVKDIVTS